MLSFCSCKHQISNILTKYLQKDNVYKVGDNIWKNLEEWVRLEMFSENYPIVWQQGRGRGGGDDSYAFMMITGEIEVN